MADLIIAHAYVVTMDGQRRMFADGAIAVEGTRILDVGPTADVLARHRAAHVIDARDMLALPGFVDGHHHPNHYLSNGIGDDIDIMNWVYKRVWPYEATLTPETAYLSAQGAFIEAIKNGTTCFNDPGGYQTDAYAQAAIDIGIRGIVNRSTRDVFDKDTPIPPNLIEDTETAMREAEAVVRKWNGAANGRIRAWFSLRYVFNVSESLCRGVKALADQYGVGIHCHAAAMPTENDFMLARVGKRSLTWYHELGLFGPTLYLVHMGYPDEREIALLKSHDVKVAHCPSASMLGAYGVIRNRMIPRMLAAGITIALGSDAPTAGGHVDMVRLMYLAACAHKDAYADATIMGAYKALEMATIDGARACWWDKEIGSLEPGKKADITLVDMSGIHWHPGRHPVVNLVDSATGRDVDTVIVDGRPLMRGRQLLTVDELEVKHRMAAANRAWRAKAGVEIPIPWPEIGAPADR